MKRASSKNKKPIKESQKISSYFAKLVNGNVNKNTPKTNKQVPLGNNQNGTQNQTPEVVSLVDSDEDFIECTPKPKSIKHVTSKSPSLLISKKCSPCVTSRDVNIKELDVKESSTCILETITNLPKCSKTPDSPECKKRKHSRENTPSPDYIPCSISPKRQINIRLPPKKKAAKEINEIHIENLSDLPKEELLILQSPSKNNQDLKISSPRLKCKPSEELIDEDLYSRLGINIKTPEKNVKKISQRVNQITPGKKKITPTKLFSKSPKSLEKFNVEVLENFVTITPSKSNTKGASTSYASANVSTRSVEAQQENESTPTKSPQRQNELFQHSRVKTKLDFETEMGKETENYLEDNKMDFFVETEDQNNISCLLNDSWDGELNIMDRNLDLTESQHCKIIELERMFNNVTLTLQSTKDKTTAVCRVEGFWIEANLSINDTLHVTAGYDKNKSVWCVSNEIGLIVFEPDFLISTTSVVGALFCKRRSVLNEKYRGFEPSNRVMVVGILVHKLLQDVLKNNVTIFSEIEVIAKKVLIDKETTWMCYESSLNVEDIQKELMEFVPKIVTFIKQYVRNGNENLNQKTNKDNWNGKIDKIQDIEENIWCPELGIKGKVDVSIQNGATTMPLELKTGRATVSLEHRGQVILYIMMMNKFGYTVPSGLLLYLREGVLREIPMTKREKRDLVILRNELTYFLTRKPRLNGPEEPVRHSELPQPINHHNACSKCPYNTICCTYLNFEDHNILNNPIMKLKEEILSHLEPAHMEYFVKWSSLLALEASDHVGSKQLQEIYTLPPEQREKNGQCIIRVKIKTTVVECGSLFKHTFAKNPLETAFNLHSSGIGIGNYVVVSTDTRPAVAAGFVTEMDHQTITISLDRDLNKRYSNVIFHLDSYNSSISQTFNMTNLALLLEASDQGEKLRKIIIDKVPPTFQDKLSKSVAIKGTPILRPLNKMQQRAILKALSSNDYLLIKGMPGTGKTATIVSLVQLLVDLDKTVLITSHTHSAVDNVCVRLLERGVRVLRLGAESKINSKLRSCSEEALTKHCVTAEQLEEVYSQARVLAVTCLGSGHPVLNKRLMDVCVVDESTQVLQCSVFRALYTTRKFILIGDPDQLPPVVKNREAVVRGLGESLFERLDSPIATVTLNLNYRMNKPITAMANALTYEGQLLIANDDVGNATLCLPLKENFLTLYKDSPWVLEILDGLLESSVKIIDTGPIWNQRLQKSDTVGEEIIKCTNCYETGIVIKIVDALLTAGVPSNTIGIIAPYRAQVSQISIALKSKNVEVSTVDQFQGRDKDIVIYSCTKSSNTLKPRGETEFEILDDKRRLTVAITRAKYKFILISDLATIKRYPPFMKLLSCIDDKHFIVLQDGELGFSWDQS